MKPPELSYDLIILDGTYDFKSFLIKVVKNEDGRYFKEVYLMESAAAADRSFSMTRLT